MSQVSINEISLLTSGASSAPDVVARSPFMQRRSTLICVTVTAFLAGLWLGHLNIQLNPIIVLALIASTWAVRRSRLILLLLVICGLSVGIWRGHLATSFYAELTSRIGQKTTITGHVAEDPAISENGYVTLKLDNLAIEGKPVPGRIRVTSPYAKLQRGYQVEISAKLKPSRGGTAAEAFAKPTLLSTRQNWLERYRQRFFAGIRTALPEPLAAFGLGLLVGTRTLLPKTLQDQLTLVGLSHLVAVSGYNLTILVGATYRPLRRISKYLATTTALWLILGFLFVSGFSASIIRASVVAIVVLLVKYYGANIKPLTLISIAAGLTAAWRPEYLWGDLGWQLSFLAFFGILVVAPAIQSRFVKKSNWIKSLLIESTSAQLMTFPLIALVFGRLSVVSPFTNFLILPLVPAAMLFSFIAGMAGVIVPAFAGWLSWPAVLIMRLILAITDWFARLKWAGAELQISSTEVAIFYGLIVFMLIIIIRASGRQKATSEPAEAIKPEKDLQPF